MEVKKYKTKPVIVEAIRFDGSNAYDITRWSCGKFRAENIFGYSKNISDVTIIDYGVDTLEGFMKADVGDYIIKGLRGEYYPCKPDVFEKKYELISKEKNEMIETD